MSEEIAAGLAETIAALRSELAAALVEGQGHPLQFRLGDVEIEFQLAVTRDASADGGVRFGVISFGAKGGLSNEATHRISLTMQPVEVKAGGVAVPAQISGRTSGEPE
ncbi:trypco2 family protein [Geodermatophilus amargosae]|uniref:trypco2 family protein n=1 Tax=Geodermatophilus amargosae TaxID=1296565 RepID=UPI0034DE0C05